LYKVGIESGKKYDRADLSDFVNTISSVIRSKKSSSPKIYFKDSLLKQAGIRREDLPKNCVGRDYNIFND
jgi:hypothetical protein